MALTLDQLLRQGLPWLHLDQVRVLGGADAAQSPDLLECLNLLAPHLAGELMLDAPTATRIGATVLARFNVLFDAQP